MTICGASVKKRPPKREDGAGLSVKEFLVRELLTLRGVDASVGMIKSIIAGAHIGYGCLIFAVKDGRLTLKIGQIQVSTEYLN